MLFPAAPAAAAAARPEVHPGNVPASQASSNELSVSPNTFCRAKKKRTQKKKKDRYKFSYTHMTKNTEQVVAPAPFRSGRPPKREEEGQAYSVEVW